MALTLISTHTASAAASITISSGIDSTYDSYEFHYVNMHPSYGDQFNFQLNHVGGSGFGSVLGSATFRATHTEADYPTFGYYTSGDQAFGWSDQRLADVGSDADQSCSGVLTLYNPSGTTSGMHFAARSSTSHWSAQMIDEHIAGVMYNTYAYDEIRFRFSGANMTGTIKMFGVS